MPTHENSFHNNEGKNATQVAYKVTWQQRENWKDTFSHSWALFHMIGYQLS